MWEYVLFNVPVYFPLLKTFRSVSHFFFFYQPIKTPLDFFSVCHTCPDVTVFDFNWEVLLPWKIFLRSSLYNMVERGSERVASQGIIHFRMD